MRSGNSCDQGTASVAGEQWPDVSPSTSAGAGNENDRPVGFLMVTGPKELGERCVHLLARGAGARAGDREALGGPPRCFLRGWLGKARTQVETGAGLGPF